jgi:hypothetical protein
LRSFPKGYEDAVGEVMQGQRGPLRDALMMQTKTLEAGTRRFPKKTITMPLLRSESRAGIRYSVQRRYSNVSQLPHRMADSYFVDTVTANVRHLRSKFLIYVRAGRDILDARCGSGRDVLAFQRAGYLVTAFDALAEMCRKAR